MAIIMALASPELAVVALTTVFGNSTIDITTKNALLILEAAGRSDIPVAKGASEPLVSPYMGPVPQVHGQNGLGGAIVAEPSGSPVDDSAVQLIYSIAVQIQVRLPFLRLGL